MRRTLFLALLALSIPGASTPAHAADLEGKDYGGQDLVVANGDTMTGVFTNIGRFELPKGATVTVVAGDPLEIHATEILIEGVLDATGAGVGGGQGAQSTQSAGELGEGDGAGGGGNAGQSCAGAGGGGGAGHGSQGGQGSFQIGKVGSGDPGQPYGEDGNVDSLLLGSGGGGAGTECNGTGVDGGDGGGAIYLEALEMEITGQVLADGASGENDPATDANGGGGGGSGGTIILEACDLEGDGTISANGGEGGDGGTGAAGGGGGGSGGRIKVFFFERSTALKYSVAGGLAGSNTSPASLGQLNQAGGVGSLFDDEIVADCDGDGIENAKDNCVAVANPNQDDKDGDGIGDVCDACPDPSDPDDDDGDGVCNKVDECRGFDDNIDRDSDGIPDQCDECPNDQLGDSDGDGSCDSDDLCPGVDDYDPKYDDDGDEIPDPCDNCPGRPNPDQEDSDLDGYGDPCDCGPFDKLQNPDAVEVCNNADDDCNTLVDDNPPEAPVWYVDADLDGQGNPNDTLLSCRDPGGAYVDNGDDCDDTNDNIFLGATEECDGVDNDCDTEIDEGLECDGSVDTGEGGGDDASGCGCATPSSSGFGALGLLALLPWALRRRRS